MRVLVHLCRTILSLCIVFWLVSNLAHADSPLESTKEWPGPWKPWVEFGGFAFTELSYGEVALFVPRGNETTLAFLDLRGKAFDANDQLEGNFAAGVRHMLDRPLLGQHWNLGLWMGGDIRRSPSQNIFSQISTGLEALSADWDVRFNGYAPLSDSKDASPGRANFEISGDGSS